MRKFAVQDTALLSGWLFADLLLGLMVIFLVSIPGIPPKIIPPPTLAVSTMTLSPQSRECQGENDSYQCKIKVRETTQSIGDMTWQAHTDMTQALIGFSPSYGTLFPGEVKEITITHIPCQTGSFTLTGSRAAQPVSVFWKCALQPLKLNLQPTILHWHVNDVNKLLSGDQNAAGDIRRQARQDMSSLHIGLIIVYGGAPGDADGGTLNEANMVSEKIYTILMGYGHSGFMPLRDATRYVKLHDQEPGYDSLNDVKVDVLVFNR